MRGEEKQIAINTPCIVFVGMPNSDDGGMPSRTSSKGKGLLVEKSLIYLSWSAQFEELTARVLHHGLTH